MVSSSLPYSSTAFPASSPSSSQKNENKVPPIVYTIAGSDSGGGAGIQADLHAIHNMNCHGCSAITCLTAQNSMGVSPNNGIYSPPVSFLREQLDTLTQDLYPRAVKVGMLGTKELALEVGRFLKELKTNNNDSGQAPYVVVDPVMISTSGSKLISDGAMEAMIEHVFPYADILTPNKFEVEALLGRTLLTPKDVEEGAKDILKMGAHAVLVKGGHSLKETNGKTKTDEADVEYAQDYFLSSNDIHNVDRLCDGSLGVWLRSIRYDTEHTHGTGCTLSSAIASAFAIGHQQREFLNESSCESVLGANAAIHAVDACVLAKAYISCGISQGVQLGKGPGPVAQTKFPSSYEHYPTVVTTGITKPTPEPFLPMQSFHSKSSANTKLPKLGLILPIVNTVEWVERLANINGITDVQLRIKNESDAEKIHKIVQEAQNACASTGVRLWINDYWEAAIEAGCFGVHLGQEDLKRCVLDLEKKGGLEALRKAGLALGISTHSYAELAVALGVKPSYISLGPVFGTVSKKVSFDPQGLQTVAKWRELIHLDIPLVAIGGIGDAKTAKEVKNSGADCIAVIGAITNASDVNDAAQTLIDALK